MRGRPRGARLTCRINVAFTMPQIVGIDACAAAEGRTRPNMIRRILDEQIAARTAAQRAGTGTP